jgi:ferredoxin-NADP reductase
MPAFQTHFLGREDVAQGTAAFRFARPAGLEFAPGQALNLTLLDPPETDARGNSRTFSIASAPHEESLQFATRLRDTAFKRVLGGLAAGTPVKLRGPMGTFTLPEDPARPVVMLAGGIGITPFMSMLRHAEHVKRPGSRTLLYSNRRPEDAPFIDELTALAARDRSLKLVATMNEMQKSARPWSGERAMLDAAFLERHLERGAMPVYYIAGPPGLVAAMGKLLRDAAIPEADIRTDEFFGY